MKGKFLKRITMALTAAAMVVAMLPMAAMAEGTTSLPDKTKNVSLTITKYKGDNTGIPSDGDKLTEEEKTTLKLNDEHKTLKGAKFEVWKINNATVPSNLNIKDVEEKMKNDTEQTYATLIQTLVTDDNGVATISTSKINSFTQGVYYVKELPQSGLTDIAKPFLLNLPMTNPNGDGWMYDVFVYPKNKVEGEPDVKKEVGEIGMDSQPVNIGDEVTWIIRPSIPEGLYDANNETYATEYKIVDKLDDALDYKEIEKFTVSNEDGSQENELSLENTDYKITQETINNIKTVTINFEKSGMKKIKDAKTDGITRLNIYFVTAVNRNIENKQQAKNNAEFTYKNDFIDINKNDTSEVYTGKAGLIKYAKDTENVLSGATFKIAANETDAKSGKFLKVVKDTDGNITKVFLPEDEGIPENAVDYAVTSGEDGKVIFTGLKPGTYYVVETKAPDGYELLNSPVAITVVSNKEFSDNSLIQVYDSHKFTLPITGGSGTVIFTVLGIMLIAGAAGIYMKARKSEN